MRRTQAGMIALALYALALYGCEHAGPLEAIDPGSDVITFSEIQSLILNRSCAIPSCHVGAGAPLGLDLSEGEAYGNLVGVPSGQLPGVLRINAGKPDSSYVVWKLENDPRISGVRMPRFQPALSDAELEAIRKWITDGAKDD